METTDTHARDAGSAVSREEAAEILSRGLEVLRSWTSPQLKPDFNQRIEICRLVEDLHNHPAYIGGTCPEAVIRESHYRARATIIQTIKNPWLQIAPPRQASLLRKAFAYLRGLGMSGSTREPSTTISNNGGHR